MIAVEVSSFDADKYNKIWVDLQIRHLQNQTSSWNMSCGLIDTTGSWDLNTCITNTVSDDAMTHCLCPTTGTIAVFLTTRAVKVNCFNLRRILHYFITSETHLRIFMIEELIYIKFSIMSKEPHFIVVHQFLKR